MLAQIVDRHAHHIKCLQGFRACDRSVLVDARFAAEVVPGFGGVDSPNSEPPGWIAPNREELAEGYPELSKQSVYRGEGKPPLPATEGRSTPDLSSP
jgi:hypothetical protein